MSVGLVVVLCFAISGATVLGAAKMFISAYQAVEKRDET